MSFAALAMITSRMKGRAELVRAACLASNVRTEWFKFEWAGCPPKWILIIEKELRVVIKGYDRKMAEDKDGTRVKGQEPPTKPRKVSERLWGQPEPVVINLDLDIDFFQAAIRSYEPKRIGVLVTVFNR